jgi:hypothetical protein
MIASVEENPKILVRAQVPAPELIQKLRINQVATRAASCMLDVPLDALVHGRIRGQLVFGMPLSVRVHSPFSLS